ncbi:MAG: ECF transporter S component [Clostridiales Family XIII bacterium]|jgi:energy-coupling factor transport system substrate-specific component|nr:ECF transporter S component [Clostridiales Family XIII bacterium]
MTSGAPRTRRGFDLRFPKTVLVAVVVILCIPAAIAVNVLAFDGRAYYVTALAIITLSMLPFAVAFEGRKPQARELVVIAVLVAITVAGRAAFFMVPQFKPVVALVIISGAALGPMSGFVVGSLSGFVSNFIFGQGPWTPWQMFAFGMIGFIAGLVFSRMAAAIGSGDAPVHARGGNASEKADTDSVFAQPDGTAVWGWDVKGRLRTERIRIALLCVFGFVITFVLYGILLDTAAATIFSSSISFDTLLLMYISGAPFNLVHAISTVVFLLLLARTMIEKLERVKKKYGFMQGVS